MVSSPMTKSVTVTFVNNIWRMTIFECLAWVIWMEMWTRSNTPITSLFTDHLFFPSQMWHWSFSKFVNRILSLRFLTRSFSHEAGKRFVALWTNDYYGRLNFFNLVCNGNMFVSPFTTRPLKSLFEAVPTLFSWQVSFLFLFIKLIILSFSFIHYSINLRIITLKMLMIKKKKMQTDFR